MKYIFPRQFGLHNVFTSSVDARETVQPFKDYTLREQEIALLQRQINVKNPSLKGSPKVRLPKRLRSQAVALVKKLQKLHSRCSYTELLNHYCPSVGALNSFPLPVAENLPRHFITGSKRLLEVIKLKTSEVNLHRCPVMILTVRRSEEFRNRTARAKMFPRLNSPPQLRTSQLSVGRSFAVSFPMAFGAWEREEMQTRKSSCSM